MLTAGQITLVESAATKPVFLVEVAHGGESELFSSSNDVIFDSRSFAAGGVKVSSIQDAQSATVELPWSPERVGEIQAGLWRGGICKIWAIIAELDDPPGTEYVAADGFLRLDGRIQSSRFSGDRITLSIVHAVSGSTISPRHTYNSVANFIPASGTVIIWEGDSITLESRR